jgi:hypothetical protein
MKTEKPIQNPAAKAEPVAEVVEQVVPVIEQAPVAEKAPVKKAVEPKVEKVEPAAPAPQFVEEFVEVTVQLEDIARVLRKSPLVTEVLLKSGQIVQIDTQDFQKLANPEDPTSIIQYL